MKTKRQTILRVLFTLLTVGTIIFIFSNSASSAQDSSAQSGSVKTVLDNIFLFFTGRDNLISHDVLRKIAHIVEYSILGVLLMTTLRSYTKKIFLYSPSIFLMGILVALCDETIQLYNIGRGPSLLDVWLDFGSIMLGAAISAGILKLFFRRSRKGDAPGQIPRLRP